MLRITVPATELYDEMTNQFISLKTQELTLEHSLVSISKWESKWHRAFLAKGEKTYEETVDYIKCMTITQNVDDRIYSLLTNENVHNVREYIEAEMTATKFSNDKKGTNREIITSEIIYYWMIELNIPFECQKWHLNKLLTLINVCNIKKTPPKKMSRNEILRRNAALNASRRNSLNTRG